MTEAKTQELGKHRNKGMNNRGSVSSNTKRKFILKQYGYINHFCHPVKISKHRKGLLMSVGEWIDNLLQPEKGRETTMLCLSSFMYFIPGRAEIKSNQNIITAIPRKFLPHKRSLNSQVVLTSFLSALTSWTFC